MLVDAHVDVSRENLKVERCLFLLSPERGADAAAHQRVRGRRRGAALIRRESGR